MSKDESIRKSVLYLQSSQSQQRELISTLACPYSNVVDQSDPDICPCHLFLRLESESDLPLSLI